MNSYLSGVLVAVMVTTGLFAIVSITIISWGVHAGCVQLSGPIGLPSRSTRELVDEDTAPFGPDSPSYQAVKKHSPGNGH